MKTFLKVVLLVVLAILALKLIPLTLGLGCVLLAVLLGFLALGVSAIVVVTGAMVVVAAVLSPIWVPVLLIIGLIALIRRATRRSARAA